MEMVTISPKFQAILYQDLIDLVPVRPARKMCGFLRGIDTGVLRERTACDVVGCVGGQYYE